MRGLTGRRGLVNELCDGTHLIHPKKGVSMTRRRQRAARWTAAVGAAAAAALLTSSVGAAKSHRTAPVRPAAAYFGGGAINTKAQGHSPGNGWVIVKPSGTKSVHFAEQLTEVCSGPGNTGGGTTPLIATVGSLRSNGAFSGQLIYGSAGSAGQFRNTLTFSGRFTAARQAIGTVRIQAAGVTNPADRCDTGAVKFQLIAPGPGAGSGAVARATSYFGTNLSGPWTLGSQSARCVGPTCMYSTQGYSQAPVQDWPMMLRTTPDGRSVALLSYAYTTRTCQSSNTALSANELGPPPAKIAKNGSFTEHDKWDEPVGGGYVAHIVATVRGRFTATAVKGTLEVDHTIASATGTIVDHCNTGVVHWVADQPGNN